MFLLFIVIFNGRDKSLVSSTTVSKGEDFTSSKVFDRFTRSTLWRIFSLFLELPKTLPQFDHKSMEYIASTEIKIFAIIANFSGSETVEFIVRDSDRGKLLIHRKLDFGPNFNWK